MTNKHETCVEFQAKVQNDLYNDGKGLKYKTNTMWDWFNEESGVKSQKAKQVNYRWMVVANIIQVFMLIGVIFKG